MSRKTQQAAFLSLLSFTAGLALLAGCEDSRDSGGGTTVTESAQIEVDPSSKLVFSSAIIGQVEAQQVNISNTGGGDLKIRSIRLTENDEVEEFSLSYTVPRGRDGEKLPAFSLVDDGDACPNASNFTLYGTEKQDETHRDWCAVWVIYEARDAERDLGRLTIRSNDTTKPEVPLELTTGESAPELTVDPAEITFEDVEEGTKATRRLTLKNSGKSPLQISRVEMVNDADGQFDVEISQSEEEGTAHEIPAVLAPYQADSPESLVLLVHYSPTRVGSAEGKLRIESNDPNAGLKLVKISAMSIKPCIQVTPYDADFGDVAIGDSKDMGLDLANCGNAPLIITEASFVEEGTSMDFTIFSAPDGLACNQAARSCTSEEGIVIAAGKSATLGLRYAPGEEGPDGGSLLLRTNVSKKEELEIHLFGRGTTNSCPIAVAEARIAGADQWGEFPDDARRMETIPLKTLELRGDHSNDPDGSIASYKWTVLERPLDSTAQLAPHEAAADPTFFIDLAGRYVFELQVVDNKGLPSCKNALVVIVAVPDEDIHIQLVWDTPADPDQTDEGFAAGSDIDVHLLHPMGDWFDQPWDCYFANPNPDWGRPANASDDPSLDRDDTDGAGPENINLDNPESNRVYRVGAHYYNDHGYGASFVTIRIFVRGIMRFELPNKRMAATDYFWDVATISWPGGAIQQIDNLMVSAPNGGGRN